MEKRKLSVADDKLLRTLYVMLHTRVHKAMVEEQCLKEKTGFLVSPLWHQANDAWVDAENQFRKAMDAYVGGRLEEYRKDLKAMLKEADQEALPDPEGNRPNS